MLAQASLRSVLALGLLPAATAQTLNINFGVAPASGPSSSYAAAAFPGDWNTLNPNGNQGPFALVDLDGNPTGVTLTIPIGGLVTAANPCTTGDDGLFLDEFLDPLPGGSFVFEGLADGSYSVLSYCFAADDFTEVTDVDVVGSPTGLQTVGGVDWCATGMHASSATFAAHDVVVSGGRLEIVYAAGATAFESFNGFQILEGSGSFDLGTTYCTAVANSSGTPARLRLRGSSTAANNDLLAIVEDLPPNQFGIFIVSRTQSAPIPIGNGNLCLGGTIGRLVGPGQIQGSGAAGSYSLQLDLTAFPEGATSVAVQPGDTWFFQSWFRDSIGQGFNFTQGVELSFQ